MRKETQRDKVIKYLHEHRSITALDAFKMGIFRLAAIIHTLRENGWNIITETEVGEHNRYARYHVGHISYNY